MRKKSRMKYNVHMTVAWTHGMSVPMLRIMMFTGMKEVIEWLTASKRSLGTG